MEDTEESTEGQESRSPTPAIGYRGLVSGGNLEFAPLCPK